MSNRQYHSQRRDKITSLILFLFLFLFLIFGIRRLLSARIAFPVRAIFCVRFVVCIRLRFSIWPVARHKSRQSRASEDPTCAASSLTKQALEEVLVYNPRTALVYPSLLQHAARPRLCSHLCISRELRHDPGWRSVFIRTIRLYCHRSGYCRVGGRLSSIRITFSTEERR